MKQSVPRLIVCTSKTYRDDFILAFSGQNQLADETKVEKVEGRDLEWKIINNNETILAVTPFLGAPSGLNSDILLGRFGKRLDALCSDQFGKGWLS